MIARPYESLCDPYREVVSRIACANPIAAAPYAPLLRLASLRETAASVLFAILSFICYRHAKAYFRAMYTRQRIGQVRDAFWTAFGRYMAPVPSANGERINWVNYKTGVKSIRFSMELFTGSATVSVTVSDPDLYQSKLLPLQGMFIAEAGPDWTWEPGKVSVSLYDVDVLRKEDWPALISFFKEKLIALDGFWQQVREIF